jgi:hypothetical protein
MFLAANAVHLLRNVKLVSILKAVNLAYVFIGRWALKS